MAAEKIDVLWLIEHVAREFDVASVAKVVMEQKYGLRVEICNLYQHIKEYLTEFEPKVVVHPYVYFVKGALATEDVFARWPGAVHVNAAWEQIHYKAHRVIKSPSDDTAKKRVFHGAWGNFYRDYLLEFGVPAKNILLTGHPAYQLYKEPYRSFFRDRYELSQQHNLDSKKRWIFVPENYRWAFAQNKLDFFVKLGGDRKELEELVEFSIPSLKLLLAACRKASNLDGVEIIFRPRPAISTAQLLGFFESTLGDDVGNIRFIKEGSVREWILASDQVISSYSTSLLEASVAGKPAWMFEPIPIPESLHCEWYDYAPRLKSPEEFVLNCTSELEISCNTPLAQWANKNLLVESDSIELIASNINDLHQRTCAGCQIGKLPEDLFKKEYFNKDSHEMDSFSEADVAVRCEQWTKHLYKDRGMNNSKQSNEGMDIIINKSMDRDDLLLPDAKPLIRELNALIRSIYQQQVSPSSWVGTLPKKPIRKNNVGFVNHIRRRFTKSMKGTYKIDKGEAVALERGDIQRLNYQALDYAEDDLRYPWFLYWEIYWVLKFMRPRLTPGMRILDAGGASSLFTCYMASKGYELHSVDLNKRLLENGNKVVDAMGWKTMHSYCMDMRKLEFPDEYFDHAFSICVFEHLDFDVKQAALAEIARCLKPGGILSLTFDYRNPAPGIVGIGKDPSARNALKCEADIHRSFLGTGCFKLIGNQVFADNNKSYLQHPNFGNAPYSFGAIFLEKI